MVGSGATSAPDPTTPHILRTDPGRRPVIRAPALTAVLLAPALLLAAAAPATANDAVGAGGLEVVPLPGAPGHFSNLAPGDRTEWGIQITNTTRDTVPLYVTFNTAGQDVLITDVQDGLQLDVQLCRQPLDRATRDNGAVVFACPTEPVDICTAPAAELHTLKAPTGLEAGATVGLRVRVELPVTAGNDFELTDGQLRAHFATTGTPTPCPNPPTPGPTPEPSETPGGDPTPPPSPPTSEPATPGDRPTPTPPAGQPTPASDRATDPPLPGQGPAGPEELPGSQSGPALGNDHAGDGPQGSLAQTGRNLLAAALGAIAALAIGGILLAIGRRDPEDDT